ncbi:hypothetical protein D3C75_531770 [compost metagenome]
MADLLRDILRMDDFAIALLRKFVQAFAGLAIVIQCFIQEAAVCFFFQKRNQCRKCGFNIPDQRHIHFTVCSDTARVDVNLNDFRVSRIESAIRKLGAEQNQRVGIHHGVEAGRKTNQPGHTYVIRVVILNVLFTAQSMDNGRFKRGGKLHQLFMRTGTTAAAHQGNVVVVTQQLRQLFEFFLCRKNNGLWSRVPVGTCCFRGRFQRDIAR